ncbi:unnamed protein product, partial [Pleuronectes platessa]
MSVSVQLPTGATDVCGTRDGRERPTSAAQHRKRSSREMEEEKKQRSLLREASHQIIAGGSA